MQYWRVILPLVIAYGCLTLASNTALYFLEIERVEQEMAKITETAMGAALGNSSDFDLEVSFDARRGHVGGLAPSMEALQTARDWVATAGVQGIAGLPLPHGGLTHTFKARSSFELREEEGALQLKAFLPEMALERVVEGVRRAREQEPVLIVSEGEGGWYPGASEDAARAPWQESLDRFVSFFFRWGKVDEAGLYLKDGRDLVLEGEVRSEEEKASVLSFARACFPGLALSSLDDRIKVVPRMLPILVRFDPDDNDGVISVEGMVPSVEIEDRLFERIRSQGVAGQAFVNSLQVVPGAPELRWLTEDGPKFFQGLFAMIKDFEILIGPEIVIVEGIAPSQEVADRMTTRIQAELTGHEVRTRFDVARSPLLEEEE